MQIYFVYSMSSNDTLTLRVSEGKSRIKVQENLFKIKNKCFGTVSGISVLMSKAINIAIACYNLLIALIYHYFEKQVICKIYKQKRLSKISSMK